MSKSLKHLRVDCVDILLAHWPPCWHNYPTYEYARAMEKLVKLGKVPRPVRLPDRARQLIQGLPSQ